MSWIVPSFPPICPVCHKRMIKEEQISVFKAIQVECDRAIQQSLYVDKFVCNNKAAFSNRDGISRWERDFKSRLQEVEKVCGAAARKYCEKYGFNGTLGELKKSFGYQGLSDKLKSAIGLRDKYDDQRIMIIKRPPDYVACPNYFAFKTRGNYHEQQAKRAFELKFMTDAHGNVVKYRGLLERLIFPSH